MIRIFVLLLIFASMSGLARTNHSELNLSIPENYFQTPKVQSVVLSPDGKHVVSIETVNEDYQAIYLHTLEKSKKEVILNTVGLFDNDTNIQNISWIDNRTLAAKFSEKREGLRDLLDTKLVRHLLVIQLPELEGGAANIYKVKTSGWLVNSLPKQDNYFLFAKSGPYSSVYRIDVRKLQKLGEKRSKLTKRDGGQFKKKNAVATIDGYATRWFFNASGEVISVLHYVSDGKLVLSSISQGQESEPKELQAWTSEELNPDEENLESDSSEVKIKHILPLAYSQEETTYYGVNFNDEDQRTLYKVDYLTQKIDVVFQTNAYKIVNLLFNHQNKTLIGVRELRDGKYFNNYLVGADKESNKYAVRNEQYFNAVPQQSNDGSVLLHYTEAHNEPGEYYITDAELGGKLAIGGVFPHLNNKFQTRMVEDRVNVEGLEIPYLLTLPDNSELNDAVPLIVVPHGGPIGIFDNRYFNLGTQFLASNGYAVLRVSFRGSGGVNPEFEKAGKLEWGNLILKDIYEATLAVLKRDDIDSQRVCTYGSSFGGYASTMLAIQYPETYKCAANFAGVSDVNLFLNSPNASDKQVLWLKQYVGDTEANYAGLYKISPVYLAKDLQRPLLIMHGFKDRVVDVEHAFRLKLALDKFAIPYEWHILPEWGHSLKNAKEIAEHYGLILEFVNKHLGKN